MREPQNVGQATSSSHVFFMSKQKTEHKHYIINMRCNKCGFDGAGNVPGGTCIKCGTRLSVTESASVSSVNQPLPREMDGPQSRPTMVGMNALRDQNLKATRIVGVSNTRFPLKKTVVQGVSGIEGQIKSTVIQSANNPSAPSPLPVSDSGELICPKCGYPLAEQYTSCPNCGFDFNGENEEDVVEENNEQPTESQSIDSTSSKSKKDKKSSRKKVKVDSSIQGTIGLSALKKEESNTEEELMSTCEKCGEEVPATFRFCPKCGTEIRQRTLIGIRHKKRNEESEEALQPTVKREFKLTIIPEENESIEPVAIHFEGAEVMLSRKNTEPDNRTITSKEQAVVFCEQGRWYIENRSEYDSTLILANRKIEILSGDIIMLGDRRFKFESEESEQN